MLLVPSVGAPYKQGMRNTNNTTKVVVLQQIIIFTYLKYDKCAIVNWKIEIRLSNVNLTTMYMLLRLLELYRYFSFIEAFDKL